jgi:hypothetical protein
MTRNKKIWLGVLTFLPVAFLVLYFIAFALMFVGVFSTMESGGEPNPTFFIGNFVILFLLIMIAAVLSIGLMIYYIMHITNNSKFDSNQRLMWILIMVFGGMIGFCVYWYLYIWKEDNGQLTMDN